MGVAGWGLGLIAALTLGAWLYWQLVIAEGVYFGQWVVTLLYDLTARRYDSIKQFDGEIEAIFLGRPISEAASGWLQPLALDVATGTGRLPLALLSQLSFRGRILAIDASREMLKVAAQRLSDHEDRVWLGWRDARRLPCADNVFDLATCLEMLEFTPDPAAQLREIYRVVAPGGLLVTTRRRGFDAKAMPGKTCSREQFAALLAELGAVDIRVEPWQVDYDLVWARKPGVQPAGQRSLADAVMCDQCQASGVLLSTGTLRCKNCGSSRPICDGIIDLR